MTENLIKFYEYVDKNRSVKDEYVNNYDGNTPNIAAIIKFAKIHGFVLTDEDFILPSSLSDEELKEVSSGFDFQFRPVIKYWISFGDFSKGETLDLNKE